MNTPTILRDKQLLLRQAVFALLTLLIWTVLFTLVAMVLHSLVGSKDSVVILTLSALLPGLVIFSIRMYRRNYNLRSPAPINLREPLKFVAREGITWEDLGQPVEVHSPIGYGKTQLGRFHGVEIIIEVTDEGKLEGSVQLIDDSVKMESSELRYFLIKLLKTHRIGRIECFLDDINYVVCDLDKYTLNITFFASDEAASEKAMILFWESLSGELRGSMDKLILESLIADLSHKLLESSTDQQQDEEQEE